MTQTIQLCSWATLSEAGKDLPIQKPETEDNMSDLLSLLDSLNDLSKNLTILIDSAQRYNSLRVAEPPYLQAIQKLKRLIKGKGKGKGEKK